MFLHIVVDTDEALEKHRVPIVLAIDTTIALSGDDGDGGDDEPPVRPLLFPV